MTLRHLNRICERCNAILPVPKRVKSRDPLDRWKETLNYANHIVCYGCGHYNRK